MKRPVFVVGTGRCGSTMLSSMLARSDRVLMLSEFFVSLSPGAFTEGMLDRDAFWRVLATPREKYSTLIRSGIAPPEILYRRRQVDEQGDIRIPPLLLVTLPFLSSEPERLYSWLRSQIYGPTERLIGDHYKEFFALLLEKLQKSLVIERSGGSLRFVADLHRLFPDALFVHLYRDGRDCARSMSSHASFRLAVLIEQAKSVLGVDPFHSAARPNEPLSPEIRAILPESFDADHVRDAPIDIEVFGRMWSTQIVHGIGALRHIGSEQVVSIRYEDLVDRPVESLGRLADKVGLPHGPWIQQAADTVQRPSSRLLDGAAEDRLQAACAIGLRLLGYRL